jgi:DNA repair exonuclease SbcCD ATPase subunit
MKARVERLAKIDGSVEKLQATLAETLKELEAKKKASKTVKSLQEAVDGHKDTLMEIEGQKKVRWWAPPLLVAFSGSYCVLVSTGPGTIRAACR